MELDIMFIGSEDILGRCRQPRREVMELVSAAVGEKHYGATLELLGVNVIFQDAGMIELGTRVSRKRKEIGVDVELSRQWAKNASDAEIRLALLQCLIKAVGMVRERLTRDDDDFDAQALGADLETLTDQICANHPGLREGVIEETAKRWSRSHQDVRVEDHKTLIVQHRTKDWGSPQDLQMRHKMESLLDECLKATGSGYCDGGDIGSGTVNIFLFVLDPHRAKDTVVEALRKAQLLEEVTIAIETDEGFEVLWPQDFVGEFSYWY